MPCRGTWWHLEISVTIFHSPTVLINDPCKQPCTRYSSVRERIEHIACNFAIYTEDGWRCGHRRESDFAMQLLRLITSVYGVRADAAYAAVNKKTYKYMVYCYCITLFSTWYISMKHIPKSPLRTKLFTRVLT